MANPGYVRSTDGDNADNGSTWALANATLAGGFADGAAGDTIYVSDNHAETQSASMTLTSPGTLANPCRVLGADDAAEPPTALATTPTISTTSTGNMTFSGACYYYGITFSCSDNFGDMSFNSNDANGLTILDTCELKLNNTNSLSDIFVGSSSGGSTSIRVEWFNTNVRFGGSSQGIDLRSCSWLWKGGTVLGTAPTTLIDVDTNSPLNLAPKGHILGVDLSPLGSNNIVNVARGAKLELLIEQCKLGSGAVPVTGSWIRDAGYVLLVNCDSADTNYRFYKSTYRGEIFHETTIVRTGGASDGTTGFSRKMVSSANTKFFRPLTFGDPEDPLCVWNETVGSSVTVTVEVVTDNVTLTDADVWIEVEYLGTSGFPLALFASDRAADILATPANQTTSSETWTTTGLTTPVKQKLSVSFTPQEKGWIQVRVMLAKASTTMYFCPKVDVS